MNNQLNQIKAQMKAKETRQAQQQIKTYLRQNPDDAQGWFLASFLHPTPQTRLEAIRRATQLDPAQADIQKRLAKLSASETPPKRTYWLPLLVIVPLVVGIVLVAALMGSINRPGTETAELPTFVVLPTLIDTPVQPAGVPDNPTSDIPTPTTVLPLVQPSETAAVNTESNSDAVPSFPTNVPNPVTNVSVPTRPPLQPTSPLPTSDNNTIPMTDVTPTSTTSASTDIAPTQSSTLPPTAIPAGSTPVFDEVVPLDSPLNIAAGQFRIVDAIRGAESLITDLGGVFPPAPSNQSWFLLEMILMCNDGKACTFSPSSLSIMGSTGTIYPYSSQLNLTPQFGSVTQNNQVWGYLGFNVPTSETQLKLILTENSKTYVVALE